MSRYIDANLVNFENVTDTVCQDQAYEAVEAVPTADVVEVVWCKDCKHNLAIDYVFCDLGVGTSRLDDYCSRGER